MNYGYSRDGHRIALGEEDELNRYSAQLYDLVATGVDLEGKDVLEVGFGRGGGISYISRYLSPGSTTAVDLNKKAIEFCRKHYRTQKTTFLQANAQDLGFEDDTFDVVVNVESSHRYSEMRGFLSEVRRVLKPGGHFLFADFRSRARLEQLETDLEGSGLESVKAEDITGDVVEALTVASTSREALIQRMVPKFLHDLARNFAATEGSPTYKKFSAREFRYVFHVLRKPSPEWFAVPGTDYSDFSSAIANE